MCLQPSSPQAGLYRSVFNAGEDVNPTVIHPTAAAQPPKGRRGAPPYLFLVTDLPLLLREYLIKTAVIEVESSLRTIFVEAIDPVPHDHVTTLQNYNMTTDTEEEKDRAVEIVRRSVCDKLFDHGSTTAQHVRAFLSANRDNYPTSWTEERVWAFTRNSIQVGLLHVVVPTTKILTPVYNVYIYPPTRDPERLARWRKWVVKQTYYHWGQGGTYLGGTLRIH